MKPLTYTLVVLSIFWIDVAWRAVTVRPPVIVIYRVPAQPANYVVPIQECSRMCKARAKSFATSMKFKEAK